MEIFSVEIKKRIDEREIHKTPNERQTKTKKSKRIRRYNERVRAK